MARATETFVLRLDTLTWHVDPPPYESGPGADVRGFAAYQWPMFFRIDGTTASVDGTGKLNGTATVVRPPELGSTYRLEPGGSVPVRAEVAQWSDQVVPIPVGTDGADFGGLFGFALLVLQPGGLDEDALVNGYTTFASSLQRGLDDFIANLPAGTTSVPDDLVRALVKGVHDAVHGAIQDTLNFFEEIDALLLDQADDGNTFAYFSQDDLPAADFDQADLDPDADGGPALIDFPANVIRLGTTTTTPGQIRVNGSISRSRRIVGEGVLAPLPSASRAVAGYATPEGYQHAIAATADGSVTELYWLGDAPAAQNQLARFDHEVVGLAGYVTADGFQHVIVPTADGTVTELYWLGGGAVGQGPLAQLTSPIAAIAGWADGFGYQHVLVATADGELTELWWQAGEVGRGSLAHLDGPFVDAAGFWADGVHHALIATQDGSILDVTWTGEGAPTTQVLTQLPTEWSQLVGLGAFLAGSETHLLVGLSDGRVRELHATPGGELHHTDLGVIAGLRPTLDGYVDPSGHQHVIAAGADGALHELWWSPATSMIFNP